MQGLGTSDFYGQNQDDEDDAYPFPLVLKKKSGSATASGQTTPPASSGINGGRNTTSVPAKALLSEGDLAKADYALSHRT